MKLVIIESPYAGDVPKNVKYALRCLKDSIGRGEAPFASHLLYPQVLRDHVRMERNRGIVCGYNWMRVADLIAFYIDLGWSPGMRAAQEYAKALERRFELRSIVDEN